MLAPLLAARRGCMGAGTMAMIIPLAPFSGSRSIGSAEASPGSKLHAMQIGERRTASKAYSDSEVLQFLAMTGDSNPLHRDPEAAKAAGFSGTIVPGILLASLFPAIIGSAFPGAVYASQEVKFRSPALVGQRVQAEVTVIRHRGSLTVFGTCCKAEDGRVLVDGEAWAKLPT